MHQRRQDQILLRTQIFATDFREFLSQSFINFPVGLRLPQRLHRFRQRMDERMHVGRVQIVFFIPGCGRQHDVAIQARSRHAEVQHHQQVELAFCRRAHFHLFRFDATLFIAHQRVLRTQQIFQEIFVTLAGTAQNIRTPDKHIAREVGWIVRIVARQIQLAGFDLFHCVLRHIHAGSLCRASDFERIGFQLRRGWQPAHALRLGVVIDQCHLGHLAIRRGRQDFRCIEFFVTPLAGVGVEERGAGHQTHRTVPVEREGKRSPASLRP